jgi:WD40 repeat protein/serine/threonine protein kinase
LTDAVHEYPEVFGYEVLGELGRGGMGVVYRARQLQANRIVALKMIRAIQGASAHDRLRFQIETEAVARLSHPNIVQLHEANESNGQPFFSLEFCDGGGLDKRLKSWRPTPTEAAELIETLARSMHYAHLRGVVHRDLKPANVLLQSKSESRNPKSERKPRSDSSLSDSGFRISDYDPKISDFGLAKRLDAEARDVSQSGAVMGTPAYMAPEQAAGKVRDTGPAADVYALGALLYECLTGRPPFVGARHDILVQVMTEEPTPPSRIQRGVPRDLETVCLKCLAKEPVKRYGTAEELAEELRRVRASEPIQARPASAAERVWKWCRRKPAVAALLATVAALLVAGTTISTVFAVQAAEKAELADKNASEAEKRSNEAEKERIKADGLTKDLKVKVGELQKEKEEVQRQKEAVQTQLDISESVVYAFVVRKAQIALENGKMEEVQAILRLCDPKRRGWEYDFLLRQSLPQLDLMEQNRGTVRSVAFSPDGSRLASGYLNGTVKIWDALTGKETFTLEHARQVTSVAFSPDSTRLASASDNKTVKLWDVQTGKETFSFNGHLVAVASVAFSPDGTRLVSAGQDGTVKVWDAASGEEKLSFKGYGGGTIPVVFSPDGKRLASVNKDIRGFQTLKLWDAQTGRETLSYPATNVTCVAFSPDGKRLASSQDKTVKLWDAQKTGYQPAVSTLSLEHGTFVTSVAFSPDGKRMASGSSDARVKLWDAQSGQELLSFKAREQGGGWINLAFSADGKRLATGDHWRGQTRVWDLQVGKEALSLEHTAAVTSMAFSPDGKRLASGSSDRTMQVWELQNGKKTITIKGHTDQVSSVAFSPDGKYLASGSYDRSVQVCDGQTGEVVFSLKGWSNPFKKGMIPQFPEPEELKGHTGSVTSLAFSRDSQRLVSGSLDRTINVWDLRTGQQTQSLKGQTRIGLDCVAFSPDGNLLVSGSIDGLVEIWDTRTGGQPRSVMGHTIDGVRGIAFSRDGQRLATGGNVVKVWNTQTGQELLSLKGHTGIVTSVAFSPDGKRLASGSFDKLVKVWDAQTGQEMISLNGHTGIVTSVAFSADGKRLVSASYDKTVKVWDATLPK